jgi:Zn-dependent peptidase ImmA (M78 family)/DNA-binding XRE family transcriptional regulator
MLNGERVRQAREIRGFTQASLASVVGVHQSNIARIEQNSFSPTDSVVDSIALHTDFPAAFFLQESGPELPLGTLLFRKRGSLKSQDKHRVRQLARFVFELFEKVSSNFRGYDTRIPRLSERASLAAKLVRSALGYSPDSPITDLVRRLERNGVVVLALPVSLDEHDAFSLWADGDPPKPTLVLTAGKPGDRLRFNLAHELGHLVLHQCLSGSIVDVEDEANTFAAEFLMPKEAMLKELSPPVTLTSLAEAKQRRGVSIQALLMRARDIDVVTERQYKYLFRQLSSKGWRKQEPVFIEPERPRLFRKMAEMVYGPFNPAEKLASLVNANPTLVEQVIDCFAPAPSQGSRSGASNTNVIVFGQRAT